MSLFKTKKSFSRPLPEHIAIIMDGNRRWARKHAFSSVLEGHNRGANRIIDVCEWCIEVGVKNLSVYAFSTENFKRSSYEVDGIFKILGEFFARELDHCLRDGVRIYIIGNRVNRIKIGIINFLYKLNLFQYYFEYCFEFGHLVAFI